MQKRQKRTAASDDSRRNGSSLPLVICVAAFLIAFSLALVYTAGLLLASPGRKVDQERCYQLAKSFAKEMDGELKTSGSSFQIFANQFLNKSIYNEYNPDNPSTVYHYIAEDNADDSYGKIKLHLYKELNEEEKGALEGTLTKVYDNANFTEIVKTCQEKVFQRYVFTVEVIAELRDMEYNYATEYFRVDQYQVVFTHNGIGIVWDSQDNCWKTGNSAGEVYEGWKDEEAEPIHYRYVTEEEPLSVEYRNVYAEAGMAGKTVKTVKAASQGGGSR